MTLGWATSVVGECIYIVLLLWVSPAVMLPSKSDPLDLDHHQIRAHSITNMRVLKEAANKQHQVHSTNHHKQHETASKQVVRLQASKQCGAQTIYSVAPAPFSRLSSIHSTCTPLPSDTLLRCCTRPQLTKNPNR